MKRGKDLTGSILNPVNSVLLGLGFRPPPPLVELARSYVFKHAQFQFI